MLTGCHQISPNPWFGGPGRPGRREKMCIGSPKHKEILLFSACAARTGPSHYQELVQICTPRNAAHRAPRFGYPFPFSFYFHLFQRVLVSLALPPSLQYIEYLLISLRKPIDIQYVLISLRKSIDIQYILNIY